MILNRMKYKLILFQILSGFFFINSVERFYMSIQGEKYEALNDNDWMKFEQLSSENISSFIDSRVYWAFYAFIFFILFSFLINHKLKTSQVNTVVIFSAIFLLFPIGLFSKGFVNNALNHFCGLFGFGYTIDFFLGSSILLLISFCLFCLPLNSKKC